MYGLFFQYRGRKIKGFASKLLFLFLSQFENVAFMFYIKVNNKKNKSH